MSESLGADAVFECLRRAAEAQRLAAASRDPAQKADLLDVAHRWRTLAGGHEADPEYERLEFAG
jgi:hypothetical protein